MKPYYQDESVTGLGEGTSTGMDREARSVTPVTKRAKDPTPGRNRPPSGSPVVPQPGGTRPTVGTHVHEIPEAERVLRNRIDWATAGVFTKAESHAALDSLLAYIKQLERKDRSRRHLADRVEQLERERDTFLASALHHAPECEPCRVALAARSEEQA